MKNGLKKYIMIMALLGFLPAGCKKYETVVTSEDGNKIVNRYIRGGDGGLILDGPQYVIDEKQDTVEVTVYTNGECRSKMINDFSMEMYIRYDYGDSSVYELKKQEGRPLYEKKMIGDSVLFWFKWDTLGNKQDYDQWMLATAYPRYDSLMTVLRKEIKIPGTFRYRMVMHKRLSHPKVIDLDETGNVRVYTTLPLLNNFQDYFLENGETVRIYYLQLQKIKGKTSKEFLAEVNGIIAGEAEYENVVVDHAMPGGYTDVYVLLNNGSVRKHWRLPLDRKTKVSGRYEKYITHTEAVMQLKKECSRKLPGNEYWRIMESWKVRKGSS
jgi:hypothetical protein